MVAALGWRNGTHLDDQVALRVPGHPAELGRQLLELRPAVGVNHPAWTRERFSGGGVIAGSELRRVFQLRLLFLPVSSHTVFKIRKPVSSGPEEQREAH